MVEWKTLRQSKGQNVQSFMEEFRKKALALNIPLDSYETLMRYIGALHSYSSHTLLLFNPTSLDEVCMQATHLENRESMFKKIPQRNLLISHISSFKSLKGRTKIPLL
jgi:hypothetical protein